MFDYILTSLLSSYNADFDYNTTALAAYLTELSLNETAYEEHRLWRKTFSRNTYIVGKPEFIRQSWHCRVCKWASRLIFFVVFFPLVEFCIEILNVFCKIALCICFQFLVFFELLFQMS